MIRVNFEEGEKEKTAYGLTDSDIQDQQWTLDRSIRKLGGIYNGKSEKGRYSSCTS